MLAIDKGPKPGWYRVTVIIQEPPTSQSSSDGPGGQGGGGGGSSTGFSTLAADAPDLFQALYNLNRDTNRIITLSHLELILLGESLVKDVGLVPILDSLLRGREIRRAVQVAVSDGVTAEEVTKVVRDNLEASPSAYLSQLIRTAHENYGTSLYSQLNDLAVAYAQPGEDEALPLITTVPKTPTPKAPSGGGASTGGAGAGSSGGGGGSSGGTGSSGGSSVGGSGGSGQGQGQAQQGQGQQGGQGPAQAQPSAQGTGQLGGAASQPAESSQQQPTERRATITGVGLFHNHKLVAKLNADQTVGFLALRGDLSRAILGVAGGPTEGVGAVYRISQGIRSVKVKRQGQQVNIKVSILCRADLLELAGPAQIIDPTRQDAELDLLASEIQAEALQALNVARTQVKGDVFEFSLPARRTFGSWTEWTNFDWHGAFTRAAIEVAVKVTARRSGLELQPLTSGD